MKKVLLSILLIAFTFAITNAQSKKQTNERVITQSSALGIRLNAGDGTGAELSYQCRLGGVSRLELGVGLNLNESLHLSGLYQVMFGLFSSERLRWYAGFGAGAIFPRAGGSQFGVLGSFGIEYNFRIPFQISLDVRPGYYFSDFVWGGVGLGIRYRF